MKVEIANIDDLTEILELQIRAYQSEAEIYNDYSIEPLIETPRIAGAIQVQDLSEGGIG